MGDLLDRADAFLDAVPRSETVVEAVGPFTLFKSFAVWSYYARPRRGLDTEISAEDIELLEHRCAALGLPLAIEWVGELAPSLEGLARATGLEVERHPLMVLPVSELREIAAPPGVRIELLAPGDSRTAAARGVGDVAFGTGGTDVGPSGAQERDLRSAEVGPLVLEHLERQSAASANLLAVAEDDADGVLASASLKPVGETAEIVGVATLPAARHRGIGAAITAFLVTVARERDVDLVLLSSVEGAVARVYGRVGFRRIGTHFAAERPRT